MGSHPFASIVFTETKSSLAILLKSFKRNHNLENISRENVLKKYAKNFSSSIMHNHSQFQSYCQKYLRSRRQFWSKSCFNGLKVQFTLTFTAGSLYSQAISTYGLQSTNILADILSIQLIVWHHYSDVWRMVFRVEDAAGSIHHRDTGQSAES